MNLDRSLLVALPFLTFGCGQDPAPAPAPTPAPQKAAAHATERGVSADTPTKAAEAKVDKKRERGPLNVILLTVDALRPFDGYSRDIAPNLSKLEKDSVVFDNHRATTSFTAQSVPAMLTGRYASTLYRSGYFFAGYTDANEFLPEALQAKGIRTIGLQSHMYFNRGKGLDQGFDVWDMVKGITYDEKTDKFVTSEKTTSTLIELLSDAKNVGGQFFAWTHYTDPHHDYIKHAEAPDYGNSPRDVYDNEVHFTDMWIGKFLTWAEKQPWWDKTAVIVSSDHGEAFGEHGLMQHAHELYEEVVRVPLIVHVPGAKPRRVKAPHTHLDLAPTIAELMGQPALPSFEGESLVPEIDGAQGKDKLIALELAADNIQEQRRAIIDGDYKLIRFGSGKGYRHKLFNLKDDPAEKQDLSKQDPDKLEEMIGKLDATFAKIPSVTPFGGMKLKGGGTANGPMKPSVAQL
ncbi:MAG: sulfatase [Myxococcales bacterium]|nr:sulfatase [Myxococcales bacterium]MCB9580774.1 sulfatase [Polyangiaceae bacterium]